MYWAYLRNGVGVYTTVDQTFDYAKHRNLIQQTNKLCLNKTLNKHPAKWWWCCSELHELHYMTLVYLIKPVSDVITSPGTTKRLLSKLESEDGK